MNFSTLKAVGKETIKNYKNDNVSTFAASLSYFTAFSLSPLLILSVSIVGYLYGEQKAQQQAISQVQKVIGPEGAELVKQLIINASAPGGGVIPTIIGIVLLLFGASRVFSALEISLNTIWQVQPSQKKGFLQTLQDKVLTFSMVGVIGFLFLVSLIASIALSVLTYYIQDFLPYSHFATSLLNFFIPYVMILFLFALILKILPDVKIPWKVIFYGSALASFLFSIGKILISYYITNSSVVSTYGAAASLVVLLLWVFYSAQILYISTEFMKAYASVNNIAITPKEGSTKYIITTKKDNDTQQTFAFGERILSLVLSGIFLKFLKKVWKKK